MVATGAVAANFVDLLVFGGNYQFLPPLPFTPGKAAGGHDRDSALSVADWKSGDRVQAWPSQGGYASSIAVPSEILLSACPIQ